MNFRPYTHVLTSGLLLALFAPLAFASQTLKLDTPSYSVKIEVLCAEGDVSCDQVRYSGRSKKSGKSIALKGKTAHTLCADGVSPCRFLGYRFQHGKLNYFVSDDGLLQVTQGRKTLVEEAGQWQP